MERKKRQKKYTAEELEQQEATIARIHKAIEAHEQRMLDPEYRALVEKVQARPVEKKPVDNTKRCQRGHPYTPENRRPYSKSKPDGYTYCVPCQLHTKKMRHATKVTKYDRLR